MNKVHTAQLRERTRREAQPLRTVTGRVESVELSQRRLNRNRKAVFEFTLVEERGKKWRVFVPSTLKHRCIRELLSGDVMTVQLQLFSYRHSVDEYEMIDFKLIK